MYVLIVLLSLPSEVDMEAKQLIKLFRQNSLSYNISTFIVVIKGHVFVLHELLASGSIIGMLHLLSMPY